ncbi:MAG: hypothetical protein K0U38_10895 [Epsilonproteobacteria bacterium]|nr:hypothetical protein [Campylobacterota bacterium]
MLKKALLTLPILFTFASADTIRPLLQIAYDGGGDDLVTIQHDYESDYTISAGDGLSFEAGMAIDNPASDLELQFLVGYKFDSDSASNGDITWDVIPMTALALINVQRWKFGGGLTYHVNPQLDGRFDSDTIDYQFDDAIGAVAQIQYAPMHSFAIGLRATFIEYELKNDATSTANANSLGIVGTFKFGGERSRYR